LSSSKPLRRKLGKYLRVKREYANMLVNGRKRSTIRLGIVMPTKHKVLVESEGEIIGEAVIDSVRYSRLSELSDKDAKMDGFSNLNELLRVLSNIYPGIKGDDWVTIIRFKSFKILAGLRKKTSLKEEDIETITRVARLALAYDIAPSSLEKRVLAAIAMKGSLEGVDKEIGGITPNFVRSVYVKALKKLKHIGVL